MALPYRLAPRTRQKAELAFLVRILVQNMGL
jgi:hypothetical protein